MIKKLRARFIVLTMASLFAVLLCLIGSINLVSYRNVVGDADQLLTLLADNDGMFPMDEHKGMLGGKPFSPETPYESRYFTVTLNADGEVIQVNTGRIAAVDTAAAIACAQAAWVQGGEQGFLGEYRYLRHETDNGIMLLFLDCGRSLATFRSFLLASCGISAVGLVAVGLLITLLSRRIVRPIAESYEKQKRFITDAGHELKTPLTIIDADAELLAMEVEDNEWLADIRFQTRRLAVLTNDLIYLSRMDEEQNRMQMIDFPLSDLVSEGVQHVQARAKTQGKTLTCRVQPMISLRGDEKALGQLLSILLDNALKYSDERGEITVTLERQGKGACLKVFNTAGQVDGEQLRHLFDRFYRGDPARGSAGGYGLGLSIAQAIVTAHRGDITATTQDGRSLLITVRLPGV